MTAEKSERYLWLDALRGFDMLLISGGATFIILLEGKTGWAWVDTIANQFKHPDWHGFTFYDFIFPLFLFIAGVSLVISIDRQIDREIPNSKLYGKAFKRLFILILLGILYKNAPVPFDDPSQIRLGSVLGRIGIATFVTTILYLHTNFFQRWMVVVLILLGYYALLFLLPVPGFGAGDLSFEGNLVGWVDRQFMPGRLLQGTYDELAILTQFPALCLTVLGAQAGVLLQQQIHSYRQFSYLTGIGVLLVFTGMLWGLHFPINKHLWSSSFILLTGGMSFLTLALFYWLVAIKGWRKWAFPFMVIGMNSLLIYLSYRFIDFNHTSYLLFGGIFEFFPSKWHDVLAAVGALILVWLFLYICYRRRIFVKV